ncbi:MAG: PBSX family phage terminase large subunit [Clostridiaceae bacterium]|nr:PBSX family phage terminase large subunit [Clostridiaceae bacterium]
MTESAIIPTPDGARAISVAANAVFAPVHQSRCRYVVLRGSAGSGKSADTAQSYILRLLAEPGRNLLCVRKIDDANRSSTFSELVSAISRIGVSKYFDTGVSPLSITCRLNGNTVLFRGILDERQREKLKSITFPHGKLTDIWIEEATELEEADLDMLDDRLRGILPEGLFYQIKLTFNPVSMNHWLKKRFFDTRDPSVFTHLSTYRDNRFLDEGFHKRMERRCVQDPDGYRVYGLGEWGISGGQYFSEWRDALHKIEPFPIPDDWRRYISFDYGLDMLAAYLIVIDPAGRAYVVRELYMSDLIISDAAAKLRERLLDDSVYQVFAPPDLWNRRQDTGLSAAELFSQCGVTLSRASNDRVAGWLNLREWLKPVRDEFGRETPSLRVFANCENLIRTLPALRRDDKNPSDVSDTPHELTHAPDALRYFLSGRPCPAALPAQREEHLYRKRLTESKLRL